MSSSRTQFRRRRRALINTVLRESPHLQPFIHVSTKWPGQFARRNQRFVREVTDAPHNNFTTVNNDGPVEGFLSPTGVNDPDDRRLHTDSEVIDVQLQAAPTDDLTTISPPTPVSSQVPSTQDGEPLDSQVTACEVLSTEHLDLSQASVAQYISSLHIPEGLSALWSIFRSHHAPNNMLGEILHWYRTQQLQLATSISNRSIPDNFKLPLDYRGAQKELQLNTTFHVDVFCFCKACEKWKSRSMFKTPFKIPCCSILPNDYESHFVVYQIHELLQLLLPFYKPKVRHGYYKGYTRLEEMRTQVSATDDDVYLSLGYDGVPFSPSSGISVYPVLATIDGLSGRHTKGSTFIIALWMGSLTKNKPDVRTLFSPIISQFKRLASVPMTWIDNEGQTHKSRVFLSTILTDTVARPQVMCLKQFNGLYGCAWCLHERNDKDRWDYKQPEDQAAARTNVDLRKRLDILFDEMGNAVSADVSKHPQGIQGRTPFADLPYLDIVHDFPPCTMHANYEGVAKLLTSLWKCKTRKILSTADIASIDEFLIACKPPSRITRPPRQLNKLKKAHEYCVWLFYSGPVVLQDHLPTELYHHFLYLVRGLSLLHKESPSSDDISFAQNQLTFFLSNYERHYGGKNGHYNIHILLHLCDFVKARGPLYRYSLMPMESYNKHLKELPTGPKYVTMQMCTRFLEESVFKAKMPTHLPPSQPEFEGQGPQSISTCPVVIVREYLQSHFDQQSYYFERLRFGNKIFHSLSYSAVTTTNSSCYKLGHKRFFEVHVFVKTAAAYIAIGKQFTCEMFEGIWYIFTSSDNAAISSVLAAELGRTVFKMDYKGTVYFTEFLNDFESYAE